MEKIDSFILDNTEYVVEYNKSDKNLKNKKKINDYFHYDICAGKQNTSDKKILCKKKKKK